MLTCRDRKCAIHWFKRLKKYCKKKKTLNKNVYFLSEKILKLNTVLNVKSCHVLIVVPLCLVISWTNLVVLPDH